jgi:hypothetical protein
MGMNAFFLFALYFVAGVKWILLEKNHSTAAAKP